MGRQILIAEMKPRIVAEAPQLLQCNKGIAPNTPTLFAIAQTGQRISNRVDVRRNIQAVENTVVAGVANNRQFRRIGFAGQAFD